MFSKSHSLLLAACAAASFMALSISSFANAGVIYNDTFARTGNLVGSSPSPTDTGGASWTVALSGSTTAQTTGSELVVAGSASSGNSSVYLPVTPPASGIISLSAAMTNPAGNGWVGIGFANFNTSWGIGSSVSSIDILLGDGYAALVNGGSNNSNNTFYYSIPNYSTGTAYQFEIDYNIGTQTVDYYIGSSSNKILMDSFAYGSATSSTPPSINYVGAGVYAGSAGQTGDVQNFTATAPVPEPATLGLFAIGGMAGGLLMLKRRRPHGA